MHQVVRHYRQLYSLSIHFQDKTIPFFVHLVKIIFRHKDSHIRKDKSRHIKSKNGI